MLESFSSQNSAFLNWSRVYAARTIESNIRLREKTVNQKRSKRLTDRTKQRRRKSQWFYPKSLALKINGLRWFWNIKPITFSPQFNGILTTVQKVFLRLNSMSMSAHSHTSKPFENTEQFKSEHAKWFDRKWNKSFLLFPPSSSCSPSFFLFNSTLSFERAPALFSCLLHTCTQLPLESSRHSPYRRIGENQTRNLSYSNLTRLFV